MESTIEGASEEFTEKVLALVAQQGAELTVATVQTGWTVDRAERYLRSLPAGARRFAEMATTTGIPAVPGVLDRDRPPGSRRRGHLALPDPESGRRTYRVVPPLDLAPTGKCGY